MFGYRLKPNFAHPYLASNLIEFWRRWHMSLSFWLRDYVYFPLGGNRGGLIYQCRNIFITMLLGGLWHGASWTFVLWGALHGLFLIVNHVWQHVAGKLGVTAHDRYFFPGNMLTFACVCALWIFFRASSFENLAAVLGRFSAFAQPTLVSWPYFVAMISSLMVAHVISYRVNLQLLTARIDSRVFAFACGCAAALMLPFINVKIEPFIYFQF